MLRDRAAGEEGLIVRMRKHREESAMEINHGRPSGFAPPSVG
jgi:hypothetical protein